MQSLTNTNNSSEKTLNMLKLKTVYMEESY